MAQLVHELITDAAALAPAAPALREAGAPVSYATLARELAAFGAGLRALGAQPGERIAVCLPAGLQAVSALFGAAWAGCVFVPLDTRCTPSRLAALLRDAGASVLVTSGARLAALSRMFGDCPELRTAVLADGPVRGAARIDVVGWDDFIEAGSATQAAPGIESDMAALLYTAGAGGKPKGVALSHRNLVAAAESAVRYLRIGARDRLLAALPLSLDYGLNQLTSAFAARAVAVLAGDLSPHEVPGVVEREEVTGLAGVPALWNVLAQQDWSRAGATLRYATSSGGQLQRETLDALRRALPGTAIYLMYGLTEAFRSTYLAPEQLERRPGSIGRPAPFADVMVLRPDGRRCAPGEAGELVQRGPLVALGYWNDPERTAECFRPLPPRLGLALAETAVWSGDTVRMDDEGYLYFIRRGDDSIKTSGYRVSPGAVEQVVYGTGLVEEAAAIGVAHPVLGQVIAVLATPRAGCRLDSAILFDACCAHLPGYMVPTMVDVRRAPLPRTVNGRIDRALLAGELAPLFAEATA